MEATLWKTPGFETNDLGYLREADQILTLLWAGYNQWEPNWIYRSYSINSDYYFVNNFGGDFTQQGFEWECINRIKKLLEYLDRRKLSGFNTFKWNASGADQ